MAPKKQLQIGFLGLLSVALNLILIRPLSGKLFQLDLVIAFLIAFLLLIKTDEMWLFWAIAVIAFGFKELISPLPVGYLFSIGIIWSVLFYFAKQIIMTKNWVSILITIGVASLVWSTTISLLTNTFYILNIAVFTVTTTAFGVIIFNILSKIRE